MVRAAGLMLLLFSAVYAAYSPNGWTALRGSAQMDKSVTRDGKTALRVEPAPASFDAAVRSAPVTLVPGRHYEVSGWVRAQGLQVRDTDRSPVATGLSLSMASLPFDVHSDSVAGTSAWKRVSLRFVATRASDMIEIRVAQGGSFTGKAYVEGVSLDEASAASAWPAPAAVKTYGPAYRYPSGGWTVLHIEGQPYERGYQHGYLMAKEIEGYIDRSAAELDSKDRQKFWTWGRTTANALFLRGFDEEILQEMKGIADGAAAANAKYDGRAVDLLDIVATNTITELGLLHPALEILPTGLEGLHLTPPDYSVSGAKVPVTERCSAFAATGKATRDGKMVIGHVTWWSLTLSELTNVMLDIQPTQGRRVLMQSYPGGIQSGTDYYQNDAGVVLTETTIRQSPFNPAGTPVAFRARKAIQYGDNIDLVVKHLSDRNNGLYTNEWLIGDAKTDEIAMFELGTRKTRLWRSGKDEWFGGTQGFYWGCNNAKDIEVRTEYYPDPAKAKPETLAYLPGQRDAKWVELYERSKGAIDEQFAFTAFRTAPLVSSSTVDAKIATSEMARNYLVWAYFGRPNEREMVPSEWQKKEYEKNDGIYPGGYRLITGARPSSSAPAVESNSSKPAPVTFDAKKIWQGEIIPASDADAWLAAGSVQYANLLRNTKDLEADLVALRIRARAALRDWDQPLTSYRTDPRVPASVETLFSKSALYFDALRRELGDEKFFALMRDFYAANTMKTVTAQQFLAAANAPALGVWLTQTGLPGDSGGPLYLLTHMGQRLNDAIIVYGTTREAGTNRYAAEHLQSQLLNWHESRVPIYKDFEATPELLAAKNVIFIGRPETNSAAPALEFEGASFKVDGKVHASEHEGLAIALENPQNPAKMQLVLAGNSPLETVRLTRQLPMDRRTFVVRSR
jgi:hypothetical protein